MSCIVSPPVLGVLLVLFKLALKAGYVPTEAPISVHLCRFAFDPVTTPTASQLIQGRHTDPITRKTASKRRSEESLERSNKRSRTSQSPCEGFSQTFSGPVSSDASYCTAKSFLFGSKGSAESWSLSTPSHEAVVAIEEMGTSSKRMSTADESEDRLKKRSRTPSPAEDQIISPSSSTDSQTSKKRKLEETEGPRRRSRRTPCPAEDLTPSTSLSSSSDCWSSIRKKRKSEETEGPRRRSRGTPCPAEDLTPSTSLSSSSNSWSSIRKKRKSEETERPRKRSRKTHHLSPSEHSSHRTTPEASPSNTPDTSSSENSFPCHSRAAFEAKYEEDQEDILGVGGFGAVMSGYRKEDNLPVAIKHLPQVNIERTSVLLDGQRYLVPLEVALLLKVKPAAGETSAVVTLLDWYDLDYDLILVLERPVPCEDLIDYLGCRPTPLLESEAKIIAKQLVDALIEIHSRGVFHRDIKLDNILIETSSDVPRVRIIDFGYGAFLSESVYTKEQGTDLYTSPEWFINGWYRAEPATVWQLGVVLFGILHKFYPFKTTNEITHGNPLIRVDLSSDCQGFLQSCLVKTPESRPTLETLKNHPWLN